MRIIVAYHHEPADTQIIHLAAVPVSNQPTESDWVPALRDTIGGRRVVRADIDLPADTRVVVWLNDRDGTRRVKPADTNRSVIRT